MSFDKTVFLPLDPDAVFELITQPERLRRWKTVAARVDLRVGGTYRWTVVPGRSAAGTFTEIEPGKRIVFGWGWEGAPDLPPDASTVSITLDAVDGGTNVRLVHEGLTDEQAASHAAGWEHYLGRLAALGATGDAGADGWAAVPDPIDELTSAEASLAIAQRMVRSLADADLAKPTPCGDLNAAQLVEHLYESIAGIGAALGADVAGTAAGPPEVRIADAAQATLEAFWHRGLEGGIDLGPETVPAATMASILSLELLVHAVDLAVATGRELDITPALANYVVDTARSNIGAHVPGSDPRVAGVMVESAANLARLGAFTDRQVSAG